MTPKEKSVELFNTYRYALSIPNAPLGEYKDIIAKQCALIAVDEILNLEPPELSYMEPLSNSWWQEVKLEIEKL